MTCKDCDKYEVCKRIDYELEYHNKSVNEAEAELAPKCRLFKNKSDVMIELKTFADELCSKFAGHSDYHGDTILSTIRCIAEGKKVGNARPLKYKKYDNHGQWTEKRARLGATLPIYACSVCGRAFTFRPNYDFCPGCGADMREGAE